MVALTAAVCANGSSPTPMPGAVSSRSCIRPSAPKWNDSLRAAGGPYQLLVIPLLTEGRRRDHVDRVLLVDVPEEMQIQRLMGRDGVSREQAQASLTAQATRAERLAMADDILRNTGRPDDLREAVTRLHAKYLQLTASPRAFPATRP